MSERKTSRRQLGTVDGQKVLGYVKVTSAPHYVDDPWEVNFIGKQLPFTDVTEDKNGKPFYTIPSSKVGIPDKISRWAWLHSDNCEVVLQKIKGTGTIVDAVEMLADVIDDNKKEDDAG